MRYVLVLLLFSTLFLSCNKNAQPSSNEQQTEKETLERPYLSVQESYDFGTLSKKEVSMKEFEINIQNTGNEILVINKADVTCGCMRTEFTKSPIKKGENGKINVKINTKNQNGIFSKPIIISSNAQNNVVIVRIKGKIID